MNRFTCNICSAHNVVDKSTRIDRDLSSCSRCGSNVRFRWTIHQLSLALFGKSLPLPDFPASSHLKGIGLSDSPIYADPLSGKLGYTNTFYDAEPRLDITDLDWGQPASLDFIISADVFEHIPPPVQLAFDNLRRLLKPTGIVIFTAPWVPDGPTLEHFPDLHCSRLIDLDGTTILVNKTLEGGIQAFTNLVFHQGDGQTLEMRVFSRRGLHENFRAAGLASEFDTESFPEYGITFPDPWSLGCIARPYGPITSRKHRSIARITTEPDRNSPSAPNQDCDSSAAIPPLMAKLEDLQRKLHETDNRLDYLEKERAFVKASRWVRLGRLMNIGPRLS